MLDANICIYVLEGGPTSLRRKIENEDPGAIITSSIAYAEVMRGVMGDADKEAAAAKFFAVIQPLPFGRQEGLAYAALPFRRAGFDRLIAAHALALDLALITNDQRDFTDVPGLRIENWTQ